MGFLLLGVDSLIACLAVGAVVGRRARLPFAAAFGICDAGGFLLGTAFHWSMPGRVSTVVETGVLLALGLYWLGLSQMTRRAAGTRWVWVLPVVLSIDNITFGLIDHSWTSNVWGQAGEQALSSALLALAGLLVSAAAVRLVPAVRRSSTTAIGFAGAGLILAAGVELLIG
jgi:hypothetical protein